MYRNVGNCYGIQFSIRVGASKCSSQILVMHYLNRVHFDAPMSPLELEIYHQMRNVIGIDPEFYEYIFTVDADTVRDSLFRMYVYLFAVVCYSRVVESTRCLHC